MAMNVLVCTKFVVDPNQLTADPVIGRPDLKRAPVRINTCDENAIEAALQVTAVHGGRVVGVSIVQVPPPRDVVLKALAMGMDALYLIRDESGICTDPLRVSVVLAAAASSIAVAEDKGPWSLVLCGESSVDEINGQVGTRLSVLLGFPCVTYATRVVVEGERGIVERAVADRSEMVETSLPMVVTVGMEINDPRMPTVLQIMGAGRKPIKELTLGELEGVDHRALEASPALHTLDVISPPNTRKRIALEGEATADLVDELLKRLAADGEVNV